MRHRYKIEGMTCNSCVAKVNGTLSGIEGVKQVSAVLHKGEVEVEMAHHLTVETLQAALPEKYKIYEKPERNVFTSSTPKEESELKQLVPLVLIFGYITAAAVLLNINPWSGSDFMLDFMGLFYIVFSFFKMLDLKGFPASFRMYDPLAKRIPVYAWLYPFMETTLGLLFLMRIEIKTALIATLLLLGITTIGVTKALLNKKDIPCACLGTVLKLPMTKATFIENTIMIVMAIFMLSTYVD